MSWVAGVDGCRVGWVVVLMALEIKEAQEYQVRVCPCFDDVLALFPRPAVIAVDIPIGLLQAPQPGGRECDQQARKLLGRRASSVFTPPARSLLDATQYEQVRSHGMSRQAFGIMPKIREVDRLMTPERQDLVYESHPELAFRSLTGAPRQHNKKTHEGREERLRALEHTPGGLFHKIRQVYADALTTYKRVQFAADDLLDACVLAWTALRIVQAQANRLPADPPLDQKGLRMEIWY